MAVDACAGYADIYFPPKSATKDEKPVVRDAMSLTSTLSTKWISRMMMMDRGWVTCDIHTDSVLF